MTGDPETNPSVIPSQERESETPTLVERLRAAYVESIRVLPLSVVCNGCDANLSRGASIAQPNHNAHHPGCYVALFRSAERALSAAEAKLQAVHQAGASTGSDDVSVTGDAAASPHHQTGGMA